MLLSRSPMTSMSVNATLNSQSTSQVTFADGTGGVGGGDPPRSSDVKDKDMVSARCLTHCSRPQSPTSSSSSL